MRVLLFISGLIAVVNGFGRQDSWDFGYANRAASSKDRFKANVDPNQLKTPKFILDQLGQRTSGGGDDEKNFYEDDNTVPLPWPKPRPSPPWTRPPRPMIPGPLPMDPELPPPAPDFHPFPEDDIALPDFLPPLRRPFPWGKLPPFFYPVLIPVPVPVPSHDRFPIDPTPYSGRRSRNGRNGRRRRALRPW